MTAVSAHRPAFSIRMFGGLAISVQGKPLPVCHSRTEHLLLALLALKQGVAAEPVLVARESLFSALYPTNDNAVQAGQNMRGLLTALRKSLGEEVWRLPAPGVRAISLNLADADVDVTAFDALVSHDDPAQLQRALSLYRGPLLPECGAQWVEQARKRRRQQFHQAVKKLSDIRIEQGDCDAALECLQEARQVDWEWEPTLRVQMRACVAAGKPKEALQGYETFRKRLKREQDREPQSETQKLREEISESLPSNSVSTDFEPLPQLVLSDLNDLIGRDKDIKAVEALARLHRLVTLTGAGGVGKTQLALHVAANLQREFKSGVAVVELADVAKMSNEAHLARVVAESLGLREEAGRSSLHLLTAFLQSRQMLLLLDNCEHVADGCAALVQELLARCPHLHLLVTSQHPLRARKERVQEVPPLAAPCLDALPIQDAEVPDAIREIAAVQLFVERARQVNVDFDLTPLNARAVAQICHALDGIPLAIVLAAARVRGLAVKNIAERLQQRFALLTQGERTAPERQQTLEAAIGWSYDLLKPREQMLLCLLPVFRGGWTLEAAEGVCSSRKLARIEVADLLGSLVDKSLIVRDNLTPEPRYRMLESIRAYCSEKLCAMSDYAEICLRHSAWYAEFAERNEAGLRGAVQLAQLRLFDAEHDNLRAALDWLADPSRPNSADQITGRNKCGSGLDGQNVGDVELRLVAALWLFWWIRGYFREGSERALKAVRRSERTGPLRAKALLGAGILSDYIHANASESAQMLLQEAQAQVELTGDRWLMGLALTQQGYVYRYDWQAASGYLNDALTLARQVGEPWLLLQALSTFSFVEFFYGNRERAKLLLQEGLSMCRALGDPWLLSEFSYHSGLFACDDGDYAYARPLLEESLRFAEALRDRHGICLAHICLARILFYEGEHEAARQRFHLSLCTSLEADYTQGIGSALDGYARLAYARGEWNLAQTLFGAAAAHGAVGRALLLDAWRQEREEMLTRLRLEMGENAYEAAWNMGRGLSSEQAAAFVQK